MLSSDCKHATNIKFIIVYLQNSFYTISNLLIGMYHKVHDKKYFQEHYSHPQHINMSTNRPAVICWKQLLLGPSLSGNWEEVCCWTCCRSSVHQYQHEHLKEGRTNPIGKGQWLMSFRINTLQFCPNNKEFRRTTATNNNVQWSKSQMPSSLKRWFARQTWSG